ncbi:hypothetical protein GCM10011506_31250 [Marivirga lumbricoides]|uniref:Phospholipid/glycerol acyltransferase domain-containing protein n=2 Tax=Marivirga lumbricoides TaxID=1046115 RepID=A0ABQ1MNE5_9BACT|nr:hypothetical protein GCM10011506_31250 [Marivirga lumbricoides]
MRRLVSAAYAFGFRNIIISGYSNIKNKKPALFVANHQSTFMDGILMGITAVKASPYILVRADIFKSKAAKVGLDLIRLLPIYRKRDGLSSVTQNDSVFEKCFQLFEEKGVVALFPEGNHAIERSLRPLQKGAARIALQAEERNNFELGLSVIPVGLHYENHSERWHDVYIHYGEPFSLLPYKELYLENPQKALKDLTDKIREGIEKEIVDIKWKEEYTLFEQLRQIIKPYSLSLQPEAKSIVHAESTLLEKIRARLVEQPERMQVLKNKVNDYFQKAERNGFSADFQVQKPNALKFAIQTLLLIAGFPLWLIAKIFNFIPEFIIENKIIQGVKDRTWHISLRVGISSFIYPIYYGLLWIIFSIVFNWVIAGLIIFALPLTSIIYYEVQLLKKQWSNHQLFFKNRGMLKEESEILKELKLLVSGS